MINMGNLQTQITAIEKAIKILNETCERDYTCGISKHLKELKEQQKREAIKA